MSPKSHVTVYHSSPRFDKTFVFTASATSAAVDLAGDTLMGLIIPVGLTGTTLTFTVSSTLAGTYRTLKGVDGLSVSPTVAANTAVSLGEYAHILAGWRFMKIVSSASETITLTASTRVI